MSEAAGSSWDAEEMALSRADVPHEVLTLATLSCGCRAKAARFDGHERSAQTEWIWRYWIASSKGIGPNAGDCARPHTLMRQMAACWTTQRNDKMPPIYR